jgi:signal transduction histidine kinase
MRRSGAVLLAAFTAVVLCFTASALYTQWKLVEIDSAVGRIADSSVPSIRELDSARSSLRRLRKLVEDYVDGKADGETVDRLPIEEQREVLRTGLQTYLAGNRNRLPLPLQARIEREFAAVQGGLDRVLARADANDLPGAHSRLLYDLGPSDERLDATILEILELDVRSVYSDSKRIRGVRRSSFHNALLLDGVCALITAVAAWLALRTTRQYARILERHTQVLERRSEELELFAKRIAHDILSPLASVQLAFDSARAHVKDSSVEPILARGATSLRSVKRIVDDLLAFARTGALPEPGAQCEVGEVVNATVAEVHDRAAAAGITIEVISCPAVKVATGPGVLTTLLSNLVVNAIKYMDDARVRRIEIRVERRQERVRIMVDDTGPGIPAEVQDAIFEPHVRASAGGQPGLGLGLATVRRVTRAHGGDAGLRSVPGRGSCFWIELPMAE